MSEGTWEDREPLTVEAATEYALARLREGYPDSTASGVHYSPCDEGCRHHDGSDQEHGLRDGYLRRTMLPGSNPEDGDLSRWRTEASWRQVDVRTLGWPMDLRPEKLAVLCLRCWAVRS